MAPPRIKNQIGFTLIEVILVTLILGIIGLFSFLFVVTGVSGYVTAVDNTVLAQKAGLALARITIDPITGSPTYVKFSVQKNPVAYRHLRLVEPGSRKKILLASGATTPAPTSNKVLVEDVSAFTLSYIKFDTDGSEVGWLVSDGMENLAKITVTLTLFVDATGTATRTFTTTVTPPVYSQLIRTTMAPGPEPVEGTPNVS